MNEKDLRNYFEELKLEFGETNLIAIKNESEEAIPNAPNTSDRIAWKGISWINYWRAVTQIHSNKLQCARCGKTIFADLQSPDCEEYIKEHLIKSRESIQAFGGHIIDNCKDDYFSSYYIVPLCAEHNQTNCTEKRIQAGTIRCLEIGATTKK